MTNKCNEQSCTAPEKNVQFYELEKVRFIIKDATGLDVAYAYDDLVFSEHGVFIIQFDKTNANAITCWFNKECVDKERHSFFKSLTTTAILNNMKIVYKGKYEMTQKENSEEISLKFIPALKYDHPLED